MKKIILFITILALSGSMYGQVPTKTASEECGCDGPSQTKIYVVPTLGTFEITYILCSPAILITDVKYTGNASPFILQSAISSILQDPSVPFTTIYFAGECARMSTVGGGGTWGEGSGPRGTVSLKMEYCVAQLQCCSMDRVLASGAFTGIPIDCDPGSPNDCIKICHPAP